LQSREVVLDPDGGGESVVLHAEDGDLVDVLEAPAGRRQTEPTPSSTSRRTSCLYSLTIGWLGRAIQQPQSSQSQLSSQQSQSQAFIVPPFLARRRRDSIALWPIDQVFSIQSDAVGTTLPLFACCVPIVRPALDDAEAGELERVFKALADRHRVKIVNLLASAGDEPVCVCDLVSTLGLKQPSVSYHLKQLADAGLIERERRGTFGYYRLTAGALAHVGRLLAEPQALAQAI
jgi:ArsR family transcriptional regulator, arsenate/arsenite/antimonite-responsive transcriptional repressor